MMAYVLVCLMALVASTLTLFSGFDLGTLLMPVVALFFPIEVAVAMTAVVHFANNLFKLGLVARAADGVVLWRFGLPAVLLALLGAWVLAQFDAQAVAYSLTVFGQIRTVTWLKTLMLMGGLIALFVWVDVLPVFAKLKFPASLMPLGGAFGGVWLANAQ